MLRAVMVALALIASTPLVARADPQQDAYIGEVGEAPSPGPLLGTHWRAVVQWDGDEEPDQWIWVEFAADGRMNYGYRNGSTYDNGHWRQRGAVLLWDTNDMFNNGLGQFDGTRISGTMVNIRGETGHWSFEPENNRGGGGK